MGILSFGRGLLNDRYQLRDGVRLQEISKGTDPSPALLVVHGQMPGHQDNRKIGCHAPEFAEELDTIHSGQFHIQERHVKASPFEEPERCIPVPRDFHMMAPAAQDFPEPGRELRFVVHKEDADTAHGLITVLATLCLGRPGGWGGNSTVNLVPTPTVLST